jgi:hypothetical protein
MYFVDFTNDYYITKKPIDELYFRQTNENFTSAWSSAQIRFSGN